jgi:YesN/AraC family two-component response regulator
MTIVTEAADGEEALECFRKHRPDITLSWISKCLESTW